jgi:hypothetical protein
MKRFANIFTCLSFCLGTFFIHTNYVLAQGGDMEAADPLTGTPPRASVQGVVVDWERDPVSPTSRVRSTSTSHNPFDFLRKPDFWLKAITVGALTGLGVLGYLFAEKNAAELEPGSDPICDAFMGNSTGFLNQTIDFISASTGTSGTYFCRFGTNGYASTIANRGCCNLLRGIAIQEPLEFIIGQVWWTITLVAENGIKHVFGIQQVRDCNLLKTN